LIILIEAQGQFTAPFALRLARNPEQSGVSPAGQEK